MLYFGRGVYKIVVEGCTLVLQNGGPQVVHAYCDGEFVCTGTSKRHAANKMAKMLGLSSSKPATAEKPPMVIHNKNHSLVFGLAELCEGLRDGIANYGLPGTVEPHVTKRGNKCHKVSVDALHDFWARCHEDIPGKDVKVIDGGNTFTTTIG
jgi:hypothetical protein